MPLSSHLCREETHAVSFFLIALRGSRLGRDEDMHKAKDPQIMVVVIVQYSLWSCRLTQSKARTEGLGEA